MTPATALLGPFPSLRENPDEALAAFLSRGRVLRLPAGTPVFQAGDACQAYLLVAQGTVQVGLTAANGREVMLYEVTPGEACVLTTACLLGNRHYNAHAMTQDEVVALAFDGGDFRAALHQSATLREFVFGGLADRLGSVIARVDDIARGDLDARLARALLRTGRDEIEETHEELASLVASVREVVSRHLKRFEVNGWVRLYRGRVAILDRHALQRLLPQDRPPTV